MNLWDSLSARLPLGSRRRSRAAYTLSGSYRAVFGGNAMKGDAQVVLVDLANWTGFYRVSGPQMSPEERAFADGMRAAYGRIFRFLRLSEDEIRQLEEAARQEAVTDSVEGNF